MAVAILNVLVAPQHQRMNAAGLVRTERATWKKPLETAGLVTEFFTALEQQKDIDHLQITLEVGG